MRYVIHRSRWPYALSLLIAGALLIAAPLTSWAAHIGSHAATAPAPAENIRDTIHNLTSGSPIAGVNITSTETEVCVFCHTPHGGINKASTGTDPKIGFPPLWNRTNPAPTYDLYDSPHFEGADATGPRGVSLACLSCHDGTVALDNGINFSGSGGFRGSSGARSNRVTPFAGSALLDADGTMKEGVRTDTGPNYNTITGAGSGPFPNLGIDLTDDHPFSMRIPSNTAPCDASGGVEADPQFDDVCEGSTTEANGITYLVRAAAAQAGLPADKRDRIRGYPTDPTGTAPFIECASCHNPHTPRPTFLRLPSYNTTGGGTVPSGGGSITVANMIGGSDANLLSSFPNSGSLVCLSCHEK